MVLLKNVDFNAELLVYDSDYQNEQACSPVFQKHLDKVSKIVARLLKKKRLVEIGCGKGFFVEYLLHHNFDITGFDPAYEGDNPRITNDIFPRGFEQQADGIILRHVLEHFSDPVSFLREIAQTNDMSGYVYIEVPCLDWILRNYAWYDIFYEHVNYFRRDDFYRIFDQVIESDSLFGGQYFYVVAKLNSIRNTFPAHSEISFPDEFMSHMELIAAW